MRYKRVSNYNEIEGRDAYIMEQFSKSNYQADVIQGLIDNYKMTQDEAVIKYGTEKYKKEYFKK